MKESTLLVKDKRLKVNELVTTVLAHLSVLSECQENNTHKFLTASGNLAIGTCKILICVQRHYQRKDTSTPRRNFSRQFYVNKDGVSFHVCKKAFLAIHGVFIGRLSRALKSFQAKSSPQTDKHGNHVPKNKTPVDVLRFVRAHIESFPAEKSHYSRNDNPVENNLVFKKELIKNCIRTDKFIQCSLTLL